LKEEAQKWVLGALRVKKMVRKSSKSINKRNQIGGTASSMIKIFLEELYFSF